MGDVSEMIPSTESEVDELLASIDAPSEAAPPTEVAPAVETQPAPVESKDPRDFEDEIVWNGEKRKLPYAKIKDYAQQAYDYSEKMRSFKVERELAVREEQRRQQEFDSKQKEFQAQFDYYKKVDEYAKANPGWWTQVDQSYKQVAAPQTPSLPPEVDKKLKEMSEYIASQKERAEIERVAKEDSQLDSQINHFRQAHPDIDWTATKQFKTSQGVVNMNLEQQICQYMIDNKIGSFRAAARDFLWDDMQKRIEFSAKEKLGKEIQKNTKAGKISTPAPSRHNGAGSPTQYSYDELAAQALGELGLA